MTRSHTLVGALAITAFLAVFAAVAAGGTAPFKPTSTLDGKTVLPIRIHWVVNPHIPAAQVASVAFKIDGQLGWVEHKPPYVYANDGNWLVTSFLKPGMHTFTAQVIAKSGPEALDTVHAKVVAAPAPPADLAGSWTRLVTDKKPSGTWKATITAKGWTMLDPQGNGGIFDVRYLSPTRIQMRPTIEHPPYPSPNNGGWCDDTDPLVLYSVAVAADDSSMTIGPVGGHDPCANRAGIMAGTWTRVG